MISGYDVIGEQLLKVINKSPGSYIVDYEYEDGYTFFKGKPLKHEGRVFVSVDDRLDIEFDNDFWEGEPAETYRIIGVLNLHDDSIKTKEVNINDPETYL